MYHAKTLHSRKHNTEIMKANGFHVFRLEGNLYVKRVERLIDGRIKIQSDNPKHETIILDSEKVSDLEVFGQVVWRAETLFCLLSTPIVYHSIC
jgi:phage repressor protein C with HTH and peptisase S24 domain